MNHKKDDINFSNISPKGFENICYDLLIKYNFSHLIWREGGADNGRDIEGINTFINPVKTKETKWFFECKHYISGGVPPNDLTSKIAWADAEQPDFLVFFISSYLTNSARIWMEKISSQKPYDIIIIEGEELKSRIAKFSDLVENYFSINRYLDLFKDIKNYKIKFNIRPSFEFLKEIIENIELEKLEIDEIGFLIMSFYEQFPIFEHRNELFGDFNEKIIYRLLKYLKENLTNSELNSFEIYKSDNDSLGGHGMFDEMWSLLENESTEDIRKYDFQFYTLHLNHKKERSHWKIGEYLFVIFEDVAFEFFKDEELEIRIIQSFDSKAMSEISLGYNEKRSQCYNKYLEFFGA